MTAQIKYDEILLARAKSLIKLRSDPKYLAAAKQFYAENPVNFINDWMMTYNPQIKPATIPFILFPRQVELVNFIHDCFEKRKEGLIEKCREVGLTWVCIAYNVWRFLFLPEQKLSFGSRKEILVDEIGNPDSIFEKIRFVLRFLPVEFLPKGFDLNKHASFMKIINPEKNCIMTGEAGDNIGRGGRSTGYNLDEYAHLEHQKKVDAALSANTDVKIYISTPNGVGNSFWEKRFSGLIDVFTFEWWQDPRKDQAWYDEKKLKLDPVIFAQEVLISYDASIENTCIPLIWVKAAVNFNLPGIDSGLFSAGLDVADDGKDLNAFVIRKGSKVLEPSRVWAEGTTTETARKAKDLSEAKGVEWLCYDSIGVGAGVRGELKSLSQTTKLKFDFLGVSTASSPTDNRKDESGKKNEDMYLNLRAQLWWLMRRRFEKTYQHVNKIKQYPPDELISIPSDSELMTELSIPKFFYTNNGKIQIESKDKMRARGVKSPNRADALILAFAPVHDLRKIPNIRMV